MTDDELDYDPSDDWPAPAEDDAGLFAPGGIVSASGGRAAVRLWPGEQVVPQRFQP